MSKEITIKLSENEYANLLFYYNLGYLVADHILEKDNEIYGVGNSYTAEYWQYDTRLGRRWNTDPIPIAWLSRYACFSNNPIFLIDRHGNTVETDYYDVNTGKKIETIKDGIDQSVNVNKEQYLKAKNYAKEQGKDLEKKADAYEFTWQYQNQSTKDPTIIFHVAGNLKTINNVIEGQDLITICGNCFDAARLQAINAGVSPLGRSEAVDIYVDNRWQTANGKPQLTENPTEGIKIINDNLVQGKAVLVGVNCMGYQEAGNNNSITNHFVVIVGRGNDGRGNYYSYYDNVGQQGDNTGYGYNRFYLTSSSHLLDVSAGFLYGFPNWTHGSVEVTEVRPNQ